MTPASAVPVCPRSLSEHDRNDTCFDPAARRAGTPPWGALERRVVQICVSSGALGEFDLLYALADDGTIWQMPPGTGKPWVKIEPLPQPEPLPAQD